MRIRKRYWIAGIIALVILSVLGFNYYRINNMYDYVDSGTLNDIVKDLEPAFENITTSDELSDHIKNWADQTSLTYKEDESGNIIFHKDAAVTASVEDQTVVCIEYNALTCLDNVYAYALGEYLAEHGLKYSDLTVLFLDNRKNYHDGVKNIDPDYIPAGANVINLDAGKTSFASRQSFASETSTISIPFRTVQRSCDSGMKLHINGIKSGYPSSTISDQANPITSMGTILTRLKSKSITFELADVKVEAKGNMYPTGIDATILFNSYDQDSVTGYMDNKIEDYLDDYLEDFPDLQYSYELIEDPAELPNTVYDNETTSILNTFIYTVKNGTYRFSESDAPDGYEENDIYGINCMEDLAVNTDSMDVVINTSALNSDYLKQIITENRNAASLSGAKLTTSRPIAAFNNTSTTFFQLLEDAYTKANDISTKDATIKEKQDFKSTACSFINEKNKDLDIVHIQVSDSSFKKIANAILNYTIINEPILRF